MLVHMCISVIYRGRKSAEENILVLHLVILIYKIVSIILYCIQGVPKVWIDRQSFI